MKAKRKHIRRARLLDFVTACNLDECRTILKANGASVWADDRYGLKAHAENSVYFLIDRVVVVTKRSEVSLQFEGKLTPINQGTHVVGAITENSWQVVLSWQRAFAFLSALMMLIWGAIIIYYLDEPLDPFCLSLFVGYLLVSVGFRINKARTCASDIEQFITSTLYVAPDQTPL